MPVEGPSAGQIWLDDDGSDCFVVYFDDELLHLAMPSQRDFERVRQSLTRTACDDLDLENDFTIAKERVRRIDSDEQGSTVSILYWKGALRAAMSRAALGVYKIECSSTESRDHLLDTLERGFPAFERRRIAYSRPRAALYPLLWLGIVAFIAWAFREFALDAAAGRPLESSSRHRWLMNLLQPLLAKIGPDGVLLIAGLFAVGNLIWMVRRLSQPPIVLSLRPNQAA